MTSDLQENSLKPWFSPDNALCNADATRLLLAETGPHGPKPVSAKTIQRRVAAGLLSVETVGRENRYHVSEVLALRDSDAAPTVTPRLQEDFDAARMRKISAEADLLELRFAKEQGALCEVGIMISATFHILAEWGKLWDQIPPRIRRVLPDLPGTHLDMIEREIGILRNQKTDDMQQIRAPDYVAMSDKYWGIKRAEWMAEFENERGADNGPEK